MVPKHEPRSAHVFKHTPPHNTLPPACDHCIDLQDAVQAVSVINLTLEAKSRAAGNSKNYNHKASSKKESAHSGHFFL